MASVLKVDKLDPQSGTALEIGTSGDTITVPSGATFNVAGTLQEGGSALVTGKILQVVESKFTTNTTTASTSYVVTGHVGTITPSATTSKILIQVTLGNANVYEDNNNLWCSLYRDIAGAGYGEIIGSGNPWFRVRAGESTGNNTGSGGNTFVDSPSSTAACNYQVYFKTIQGTLYYQNSGAGYGLNNMILMEIGA